MKLLVIWLIQMYQVLHHSFFSGCCRFYPSCSNYTLEAVKTHGVFKGLFLGLRRILRCQPFGKSGYDPVPLPKSCKRGSYFG